MEDTCQKCGRVMRPGQLKYQVRIDITSLYDGVIEVDDQITDEEIDLELDRLIEAVSRQDPAEVAKDIIQSIVMVVCRDCRNGLVREWEPKGGTVLH